MRCTNTPARQVDETIGLAQIAGVRRAMRLRPLPPPSWKLPAGAGRGGNRPLLRRAAADRAGHCRASQDRGRRLHELTGKREQQREAAHADTVKAQLQQQQREREFSDARVNAEKARLELGVLLFPDPRTPTADAPDNASLPRAQRLNGCRQKQSRARSALATLRPERRRRAGGSRRLSAVAGAELHLRHRCAAVCTYGPWRTESG